MRRVWFLFCILGLTTVREVWADELSGEIKGRRIDSRYCTLWLHPEVEARQVNKRINTWRLRVFGKSREDVSEEEKLAAKCDTIFRRAEEILDMYPPGIHVTVKVAKDQSEVTGIHASRYGYNTQAIAFYDYEDNTIFVAVKDLSEGVLAHEMAHCIIDHYFRVRPPRKIEELLAMHVDEHLRD